MFSAEWLALREPADVAARSAALARDIAGRLKSVAPVRALDLACGTGSNARYLAEYIEGSQHWLLLDHDRALLDFVPERTGSWARARQAERVTDGEALRFVQQGRFDCAFTAQYADLRSLDAAIFAGRDLVTASALLDLVSDAWIQSLCEHCRVARATVMFALSYDGRLECTPREPADEHVRQLVNEHQRTDKGFGAALGPSAADYCASTLVDLGYLVRMERSDWLLGPNESELQRQLIEGWARAAKALHPDDATLLDRWQKTRLEHVDRRRSQLLVGHQDLSGWLDG